MNFNTICYLFKEGANNLLTSKKTAIASFLIILATMLMLGIFMLLTGNIENMIKLAQEQQGIMAYIDDVSAERREEIISELKNIFSVKEVVFVSKEEGWEKYKQRVPEGYEDALSGFENDLPIDESFIIKLDNLEQVNNVIAEVQKIKDVNSVQNSEITINAIVKIANIINIVGIVILVILLCISIFIISNTIKITMYARRKEISIMKYVGATDGFIRLPFIVEGMIIGLLGACISTFIVGLSYTGIYNKYLETQNISGSILNEALIPFSQISQNLILIYIILGVGIGIVGSTMSIKKYLDV